MGYDHFIIVGAMKSGTTSLHRWLQYSSDIYLPRGESHYFDQVDQPDMSDYITNLGCSSVAKTKKIGDDTPTYSYLSAVPIRIKKILPDVKLIWMLRDPLERAVSNYWHAVCSGIELRDINTAMLAGLGDLSQESFTNYIKRSNYVEQITRYLSLFDREQMLFVDFKRFTNNDPRELSKICQFLEITPIKFAVPRENVRRVYPRPYLNKLLTLPIIAHLPQRVKTFVQSVGSYNHGEKPTLTTKNREELTRHLIKVNSPLDEIVGGRFDWQ